MKTKKKEAGNGSFKQKKENCFNQQKSLFSFTTDLLRRRRRRRRRRQSAKDKVANVMGPKL